MTTTNQTTDPKETTPLPQTTEQSLAGAIDKAIERLGFIVPEGATAFDKLEQIVARAEAY